MDWNEGMILCFQSRLTTLLADLRNDVRRPSKREPYESNISLKLN